MRGDVIQCKIGMADNLLRAFINSFHSSAFSMIEVEVWRQATTLNILIKVLQVLLFFFLLFLHFFTRRL